MIDVYAALKVNPFEDDAVTEPRAVTFSVEGLNDKPLVELLAEFDKLTAGKLPRQQIAAAKAQLVVSPDAGYGKSHLLGRLFQKLGERATQIYLRPFQDPQRPWNSILLTTVQELERPSQYGNQGGSQLEAFAMGVMAHVAADFMADGGVKDYAGVKKEIEYLRDHPLEVLGPARPNKILIDWLHACLDHQADLTKLVGLLKRRGVDLGGREKAWLRVLAGYAFTAIDSVERDAALTWLRGEPLEDEQARALKLADADNDGGGDVSAWQINDLSLRRLRGLCALSSYFRPFLFCFDQTEFYGSDKALADALGNCIEELYATLRNHLTIVTTNATNWTEDIRPNLKPACQHRFSSEIGLEGINIEQARELITMRLKDFQLGDAVVSDFIEPSWLTSHFETQPHIGVRRLLVRAAERFRALAQRPPQKCSMEEAFAIEVNKIRAKPALHQYNQDCLMWFVQTLVEGFDGVMVAKPKQKYFSTQWDWTNRSVYFAFEGGDHNARWRAIAKEAVVLGKSSDKTLATIVFRTPDLKSIPRPGWGPAKQQIEVAARSGLQIIPLDLGEVCELHAAREFYSNALQGNVDYAPPEVLGWLKDHFARWFEKYSHPEAKNGTPPPNHAQSELTPAEFETVMSYVKNMKLVNIKEVLMKLGRESLKEALLRAVDRTPNLKAHPGPQTIYLQWRISV
ncbi:MAG: hypothetical protein ACREDT_14120 [Methylocella sp.]